MYVNQDTDLDLTILCEALKRLNDEFLYENNLGLCGVDFASLQACNVSGHFNSSIPEPYEAGVQGLSTRDIPETANVMLPCNRTQCLNSSKSHGVSFVLGSLVVTITILAVGTLTYTQYRRRKQKFDASIAIPDGLLSTDQVNAVNRKNGSPLISLEYSNGWDPLADGRTLNVFSQEVFHGFRFNLEEVETATQYFSEMNLLGKSCFSATYKGILRDGSVVAIKSIGKSCCKSEEAEFLKGLNVMTSLRHENLVRLRGFRCPRGARVSAFSPVILSLMVIFCIILM